MDIRYSARPRDVKRHTTQELRDESLITGLYRPDGSKHPFGQFILAYIGRQPS